MPVHRHEPRRDGVMPSASTVMHQLAWELIPSLQGVHAGDYRAEERSA
jgi:chromosome partitioning related protein ParA